MKHKLVNNQTKEEHLCDKVTIDGFDYYISEEKSLSNNGDWYLGHPNYDTLSKWSMSGMHEGKQVWINKLIATTNPNIDIPKVIDEVWINKEKNQELIDLINHTLPTEQLTLNQESLIYHHGKSQQAHSFSEKDMIEFERFCSKHDYENGFGKTDRKELLQLWKEQQLKIIYYEN